MKNKIRVFLLLVFCFCLYIEAQETRALKVLMIGNSFSICVQRQMPQVANALGLDLDLASLYIGGCSLERHWNNVVAATNASFKPYQYCRIVRGKTAQKGLANSPEILSSEKWDVVVLQQASHFSWHAETYEPFGGNMIAEIKCRVPGAKIVVQETWSYSPFDKRLAKWGINRYDMYDALHVAYALFAKRHGCDIIPMGTAVQYYRAALPVVPTESSLGGDVCGTGKFSQDKDGKWCVQGDSYHLNPAGEYLQGLVWTAALFGVDVRTCSYRPDFVTEGQALLMKNCAMEVVRKGK